MRVGLVVDIWVTLTVCFWLGLSVVFSIVVGVKGIVILLAIHAKGVTVVLLSSCTVKPDNHIYPHKLKTEKEQLLFEYNDKGD